MFKFTSSSFMPLILIKSELNCRFSFQSARSLHVRQIWGGRWTVLCVSHSFFTCILNLFDTGKSSSARNEEQDYFLLTVCINCSEKPLQIFICSNHSASPMLGSFSLVAVVAKTVAAASLTLIHLGIPIQFIVLDQLFLSLFQCTIYICCHW